MAQTLCIKCGSELKVSSSCQLCQEPLTFACTSCDYITEEKVHTDCRNAEVLAKTAGTKHKEEEEEMAKAEPRSTPSYMTTKQDNKDFNNVNPFVAGTALWKSLMTYWFNAYGEFIKSAPKMTEDWYNTFWKPSLNWAPKKQQQQQRQDKVK